MSREQKKNYITEMENQFQNNEAVLVTHYQGLTMSQLDELRSQMREHGIKFRITKNRITKIALEKTKCKELSSLFIGPTAVAFSDDAISSAKILTKFAKSNSNLKIIGGVVNDKVLDVSSIQQLAKLPSLDVLRGKIVGILQTPAANLARVVQAPAGALARVVQAYADKN